MKGSLAVYLSEKERKRHVPNYVMKYIFPHTYARESRESLKLYIPNRWCLRKRMERTGKRADGFILFSIFSKATENMLHLCLFYSSQLMNRRSKIVRAKLRLGHVVFLPWLLFTWLPFFLTLSRDIRGFRNKKSWCGIFEGMFHRTLISGLNGNPIVQRIN